MNKNQEKSVMKGFAGKVRQQAGMPLGSTEPPEKGYSRPIPGRVEEPQEEQERAKEPPEEHQGAGLIYFGKSQ